MSEENIYWCDTKASGKDRMLRGGVLCTVPVLKNLIQQTEERLGPVVGIKFDLSNNVELIYEEKEGSRAERKKIDREHGARGDYPE